MSGSLVSIDLEEVPFVPRRIFFVYGGDAGEIRGKHAHRETEQMIYCLHGSIRVSLEDGKRKKEVVLTQGDKLYHARREWAELEYLTGDDVLLSICSTKYNEKDYIRDHDEFLKYIENSGKISK